MEGNPNVPENHNERFIERCKDALNWTDLSRDVIMDVGCGEEGKCGKAVLEKFPDVGKIIFVDKEPSAIRNFKLRLAANMELAIADIEKRKTLGKYEGKMNKVISSYTFLKVEKEEALRNVYRLLKPGGEAAVLFVRKFVTYDWLMEMIKKPKWNAFYKKQYNKDLFLNAIGKDEFEKMAEKVGFQVLHCGEEEIKNPYPDDELCKEALYYMCRPSFNIPTKLIEEFKEDSFRVFLTVSPRDCKGRPCYRTTELFLLVSRPEDSSSSKTK